MSFNNNSCQGSVGSTSLTATSLGKERREPGQLITSLKKPFLLEDFLVLIHATSLAHL